MAFSSSQRTQLVALLYIVVGALLIIASGLLVPLLLLGFGVYCIYEGMWLRGFSLGSMAQAYFFRYR